MRSVSTSSLLAVLSAVGALGQQTQWGQCGGNGWTGPTTCVNGWTCVFSNPWYSQCLPGSSSSSGPSTTSSIITTNSRPLTTITRSPTSTSTAIRDTTSIRTSTSTTRIISTTVPFPTTTRPSTTTTTPVVTGTYPGPTLLPGYYWIRAVTTPHFHEYLQNPSPGTAVLGPGSSAGQYAIVSGQLVQTTASGLLYANVEQRESDTDLLLGVTFKTTQNTYGTWNWSGDSLQWSVSGFTRPNPSAWYVCGTNNQLFINLGQYLYGTPAGCTDHTIHYYNGATADL